MQHVVNKAFSTILRREIVTTGSGRTDAGVHCRQQFFHADIEASTNPEELLHKINSFLPHDIAITGAKRVKDGAHARFDAQKRSYEYRIHRKKNPFLHEVSFYFPAAPDIALMNRAAEKLLTWEDFQCFSRVKTDVSHFKCCITEAHWKQENESLVFSVKANRFLRGMVRAITGTLLDVGTGKTSLKELEFILESRDRRTAGRAVPPHGLFLTGVSYPESIYL